MKFVTLILFVTSFLPSRIVLAFTAFCGACVRRFCERDERVAIAQIEFANRDPSQPQHIPNEEIPALAKTVFRQVGESFGELLIWKRFVSKNPNRRERITTRGVDVIAEVVKSGTPALGLSAHLGSFELLAVYLAKRGVKCTVIGRSPNYPSLEKAMREFREAYGVSVIWSDAPDAARQIIQAVRNNQVLCVLLDQDTKWKSDFSPFFGLEAACPIAPVLLAIREKLPIFTSFIVRTGKLQHEVITEYVEYNPKDSNAKFQILSTFHRRLEALIRKHPDQYIWWHRRWRRRPGVDYTERPDLLRGTSSYISWLKEEAVEARG